jgi:magnesium chelatase family protein
LDRIDIPIEVPALTSEELLHAGHGEPSQVVRERVLAARARQQERGWLNAHLPNAALERHCLLDSSGARLIADAIDRGGRAPAPYIGL